MFTHLLLLSFSDKVIYSILSVPIILAIISWVMNIRKVRSGKAAGLIFNGDAWVKWVLLLFIGIILLQVASWWLPKDWGWFAIIKENMSLKQKLVIPCVTAVYFLTYFFIAFRPATAEELKEAKGAKQLAIDFASSAAAGATGVAGAAGTAVVGFWGMIMSLLYPIVTIGGQTFMYMGVGAASFFASLVLLIPIVVILAMLGVFVIMVVTFLTFGVMVIASIVKFVTNLRYHFR